MRKSLHSHVVVGVNACWFSCNVANAARSYDSISRWEWCLVESKLFPQDLLLCWLAIRSCLWSEEILSNRKHTAINTWILLLYILYILRTLSSHNTHLYVRLTFSIYSLLTTKAEVCYSSVFMIRHRCWVLSLLLLCVQCCGWFDYVCLLRLSTNITAIIMNFKCSHSHTVRKLLNTYVRNHFAAFPVCERKQFMQISHSMLIRYAHTFISFVYSCAIEQMHGNDNKNATKNS